jgi:hypothetical protein
MLLAVADAEAACAPLVSLGLSLTERVISPGSNARYDGWHLSYASESVTISLQYYEWELLIPIKRQHVECTYYLLDRELSSNASGLQGCMFGPEKLSRVTREIVQDLCSTYCDVLLGAPEIWERIEFVVAKRERDSTNERERQTKSYVLGSTIKKAMEAFRIKDYGNVCRLLGGIEEHLEPLQAKKLAYARKKVSERGGRA